MSTDSAAAEPLPVPGRVSVSSRALERVFSAVAADALGAPAASVSTSLGDRGGLLAVRVDAPAAKPLAGDSLVDAGGRTRERVRVEGARIAGSVVADVGVRIRGIEGASSPSGSPELTQLVHVGGESVPFATTHEAEPSALPPLDPRNARLTRTLARRESRRSRSTGSAIALVLLALGAAYAGVECALAASGAERLLITPDAALAAWRAGNPWVLGGAAVAALLGVAAIVAALDPARRPRHGIADDRAAILVDDGVLASALSREVARRAGVAPGQVRTTIGRRIAEVSVTPTSGSPLDAAELTAHAAGSIETLGLRPAVRARVRIAENGVVGS